jgi:hypothetical protein
MAVSERNLYGSIGQAETEKDTPKVERSLPAPDSPEEFFRSLEREIEVLREETVAELDHMKTDSGLSPKEITEVAREIGLVGSLREIDREATDLMHVATADSEEREAGAIGKNGMLVEELSSVESRIATLVSEGREEMETNDELKYLKLKKDVIGLEMLRERAHQFEKKPSESDESERERQRITEVPEEARIALKEIERISAMIEERGYDYASFQNLDTSNVPEEREFYERMSNEFDRFGENHADAVECLNGLDAATILEFANHSESRMGKAILIGEFISYSDRQEIPVRRLLETIRHGGIGVNGFFEDRIKREIIRQKEMVLQKFPADMLVDELLSGGECMPTGYMLERSVKKVGEEIRYRIENGDVDQARGMVEGLRTLNAKSVRPLEIRMIQAVFPEIPTEEWGELLNILEGGMSQSFYDRYRETYDENGFFRRLVPERCVKMWDVEIFLKRQNQEMAFQDLDVFLSAAGLSFSELDIRRKKWAFTALKSSEEVEKSLFTVDDIRQLLLDDNGGAFSLSKIPNAFRITLKREMVANIQRLGTRYYSNDDIRQAMLLLGSSDIKKIIDAGQFIDPMYIPESMRNELRDTIVNDAIRRKLPYDSESRIIALSYFEKSDFEKLFEADIRIYPFEVPESLRDDFRDSFVRMGASLVRNGFVVDALIGNPDYQVGILDMLVQDFDERVEQSPTSDIRQTQMRHIRDSFYILDSPGSLPEVIREVVTRFEDRYGERGKHLIALAVTAYGADDPERFVERMRSVEKVLDRYYEEDIPDGAHVSVGFEYEVTNSVGREYDTGSVLGYVNDINLASRSGFIGKGFGGDGAIYEIATKPTYNPYLLMAERKLLQDAGFIDFNFERYPKASRGYHLNIGGESGLAVDQNAHFLSNVMTMAQLNGAIAGKDVTSVKGIYEKRLDDVFDGKHQGGVRVEMKGGGCDTVEQFERAILTSHYAGVAIQLCDRYIASDPTDDALLEISDDPETFEQMLEASGGLLTPFRNIRERDMVHSWILLKRDMVLAVDQHNESFFESEFDGSFVNPKGEYIETADQIDVIRNQRLVSEEDRVSEAFKKRLHIEPTRLFGSSTPAFENAIVRTNNIFLKGPNGKENSSVNAGSMLMTMKRVGSRDLVEGRPQDSIFDSPDGTLRDGYYSVQGASEEMITHKSQILLGRFNTAMERLLRMPISKPIAVEA